MIKSYTYQLFTLPFIELLKFIISKGADPLMKVGKTKFYRELDEHKRHLAMVGESRDIVSAVNMQINTMQKQEDVKTRNEVMAERQLGQKVKKGKKGPKIDNLLKEFYAKKNHSA
jgi:cupin superfamily acireductone dioxygenase involved in methionine salvage